MVSPRKTCSRPSSLWPRRTCPRATRPWPSLLYYMVDASLVYGEVPSNLWSTIWHLIVPRPKEYASTPSYLCSQSPLKHLAGPEGSGSTAI